MSESLPHKAQIDDMGFVTHQDVCDLFVKKIREFEELLPQCPMIETRTDKKLLVDFLDGVRLELLKKSRTNIEIFVQRHPELVRAEREARNQTNEENNYRRHQERVRLGSRFLNGG